jgi:hypothetical protein
MKKKYFSAFFCSLIVNAQQNKQKTDTLQEVVITSSRIALSKKIRTIQLITEDIKNLEQMLPMLYSKLQVVRRRGLVVRKLIYIYGWKF